jgi:signal transduction histidine kinase
MEEAQPQKQADWYISNYDPETCDAPNVDTELGRLSVLKKYNILDQERQDCYDRAASVCSRVFDAPIAMVNIIDLGRIWVVGSAGLPLDIVRDYPRRSSFCAHAILNREAVTVVPDATKDPRFAENHQVTGPNNFRFYAAASFVSNGHKLGTLCVFDTKARPEGVTAVQKETLIEMGELVMEIIKKTAIVEDARDQTIEEETRVPSLLSSEVETTVAVLHSDLTELSKDTDLQKHMTPWNKRSLDSAFESAKHLYNSLVDKKCKNKMQRISREGVDDQEEKKEGEMNIPQAKRPVGNIVVLDIPNFINSLQFVMHSFPKKVHLDFSVDPAVPERILANDMKVFRSAISLLTNACERTQRGFVRITIKLSSDAENKHVVLECEDTGPSMDMMECQEMFKAPTDEEYELLDQGSCISVDEVTGKIKKVSVCQRSPQVASRTSGLPVHIVAEYIASLEGKYGCRPRVAENNFYDPGTGTVLWFSFPLSLPSSQQSLEVQEAISSKRKSHSDMRLLEAGL